MGQHGSYVNSAEISRHPMQNQSLHKADSSSLGKTPQTVSKMTYPMSTPTQNLSKAMLYEYQQEALRLYE
jgi:hypothetical protein